MLRCCERDDYALYCVRCGEILNYLSYNQHFNIDFTQCTSSLVCYNDSTLSFYMCVTADTYLRELHLLTAREKNFMSCRGITLLS
jgi:hypothetical protein